MKEILDAIETSIKAEVAGFSAIKSETFDPVEFGFDEQPTLFVYGARRYPGDYRTTETREDIYEVRVLYMESAQGQANTFTRDDERERAVLDIGDDLVAWADNHQTLATSGGTVHRLDFTELSYPPEIRRNLLVRLAMMTLYARKQHVYG